MLKVKPSRLKPLPVTLTLFRLITTEYTIGKIVTAAMTISAGAVNAQPIRASRFLFTSGRPTSFGSPTIWSAISGDSAVMGPPPPRAGWDSGMRS